jgi:hypothetical protein
MGAQCCARPGLFDKNTAGCFRGLVNDVLQREANREKQQSESAQEV